MEPCFVRWSFFLLTLLCIAINLLYGHAWNTIVIYGLMLLELLDKLQKRIYRTIGPSLATSLQLLTQRRNVASLSLFCRYYFGRCGLVYFGSTFLFSKERSTRYSDRLHDFSVIIPRCYKNVYVNSFFLRRLSFDLLSKWLSV